MSLSVAPTPGLWRRFTAAYAQTLTALLALSVAILVIPVTLQIISRYTSLIPSYIWTEELARFLFIWTIMIGAILGVSHQRVSMLLLKAQREEKSTTADVPRGTKTRAG